MRLASVASNTSARRAGACSWRTPLARPLGPRCVARLAPSEAALHARVSSASATRGLDPTGASQAAGTTKTATSGSSHAIRRSVSATVQPDHRNSERAAAIAIPQTTHDQPGTGWPDKARRRDGGRDNADQPDSEQETGPATHATAGACCASPG